MKFDSAFVGDRISNFDRQVRVAVSQRAALRAIWHEVLDFDADWLARATARAGRAVQEDALAAIARVQALFELPALQ